MSQRHSDHHLMRAVVQTGYGSPDTWRVDRIERPRVSTGQVLVRVEAAAIDRGTWHLMRGEPLLMRLALGLRGLRHPVPGRDLAGTVIEVGAAVSDVAVGDEVYGTANGSLAEFALAKAARIARRPPSISAVEAAAMPVSGQTALQAVSDIGRVRADMRVLITGASGGVGSFAVQMAAALGADVTAVCSAGKSKHVRELGAARTIDYRTEDPVADLIERFDVIIDIGGRLPIGRLRRALVKDGTLVLVGGIGGGRWTSGYGRMVRGALRSPFVSQRIVMLASRERRSDLERLAELIERDAITPAIDSVVSLDDAASAMRRLEDGLVTGKVVVRL
jgi:NADPH:quinone reductase-like Zn-dependent oxidoreductase